MKNYIVYLAFGGQDYLNEALYSLLSFLKYHKQNDEIKIIIYTDNSLFFKEILPFEIIYCEINSVQIKDWKGSINYVFRVKTKVLQDACSKFNGNFLFVDTDTYFLKSCNNLFEQISAGVLFLDTCEGKLKDNKGGIARKTKRFLKKQHSFFVPSDSSPVVIDREFLAWNSGVIGFTNTIEKTLIQIEELIDLLYSKSKLFVVEQIALSYYFQKIKEPKEANEFIHHYWDFKEFRIVLKEFFEFNKGKDINNLIDQIHKIDPQFLASEKRDYRKKTFLQKQLKKLIYRNKWTIPKYRLD